MSNPNNNNPYLNQSSAYPSIQSNFAAPSNQHDASQSGSAMSAGMPFQRAQQSPYPGQPYMNSAPLMMPQPYTPYSAMPNPADLPVSPMHQQQHQQYGMQQQQQYQPMAGPSQETESSSGPAKKVPKKRKSSTKDKTDDEDDGKDKKDKKPKIGRACDS